MSVHRTAPERTTTRRTERTRPSFVVGPGMIIGLIATAGLVVSMFLSWRSGNVHPSEIPAAFLWDRHATGDPSLLVFLIPLAVLLGIGSLVRGGGALRILAGLLTLVVVGLYGYQLREVTHDAHLGFRDALDTGVYVAAISGLVGLISGFVPNRLRSRRVDRYDEARYDDARYDEAAYDDTRYDEPR